MLLSINSALSAQIVNNKKGKASEPKHSQKKGN